jgi:glycine/D-amino acid oxidase-like deaminating enzyme
VTESADVVVVGGGAIGASTAWHLAELGITDVVLVERDQLASGSTSKSAGGFRAQFADELNIRIALRSIAELERFPELTLERCGYLFLLDNEEDLAAFREAVALQRSLGVPTVELSVDEAVRMVPQIDPEGLVGATFCPLDGHVTPEDVVRSYATAAAARGVRVRQGCAVTAIEVLDGRIASVDTTRGPIATDTVVCAAGAWSPEIGAFAGVDIPVRPERRWTFFSASDAGFPADLPLTVDFSTSVYLCREGKGIIVGGRQPSVGEYVPLAVGRFPALADCEIQSSWWGYYEMSPDHNAIVGTAGGVERFYVATGFSGHGFQQAPAVGEHLAELVAGREPTLDLSPFALDRFESGGLRPEQFVI